MVTDERDLWTVDVGLKPLEKPYTGGGPGAQKNPGVRLVAPQVESEGVRSSQCGTLELLRQKEKPH